MSQRRYEAMVSSMFSAAKSDDSSPYPDVRGDPNSWLLIVATTKHPGSVANANARRRWRCAANIVHPASTAASGNRFGRIRIASDVARPAATALETVGPRIQYVAIVQNAAAGMSLICDLNIMRNVGLVATSHAPASPRRSEPRRRPSRNVDHTSNPPVNGTTRNAAAWFPMDLNAAINNGSPGGVIGAMAASRATAA